MVGNGDAEQRLGRHTKRLTIRPTQPEMQTRKVLVLLGFLDIMEVPQSASPAPVFPKCLRSVDWCFGPIFRLHFIRRK